MSDQTPDKASSNPCYVGGKEALKNNVNILKKFLDAKSLDSISEVLEETAKQFDSEIPTLNKDNIVDVFAELIAREELSGGNPEAYRTVLSKIDFLDDAGLKQVAKVANRQNTLTQAMLLVKDRLVGISEQLYSGKNLTKKEVKDLELGILQTQAQLKNYAAKRSVLGTGLSHVFSMRKVANVEQEFNIFTEKFVENLGDMFSGETFLSASTRNTTKTTRLKGSVKELNKEVTGSNSPKTSTEMMEEATNKRSAVEDEIADVDKEINKYKDAKLATDASKDATPDSTLKELEAEKAELKAELKEQEQVLKLLPKGVEKLDKKTLEKLIRLKEAQKLAAEKRLKASDIRTEELHDEYLKQKLGSAKITDYAKRVYLAAKLGKGDDVIYNAAKSAEQSGFTKGLNMSLQVFMGNILSGPSTYVINAITPAFSRTIQRLELATGGLLTKNPELTKATVTMHNLAGSVSKAIGLGGAAFRMDRDVLLGAPRAFDEMGGEGAFASSNFNSKFMSSEPISTMMNWLNTYTRLPNRINGAADVINKSMAVDKYLSDHFTMEALNMKMNPNNIEQYVKKNVNKMFNEDGSLFSEDRMIAGYTKQAINDGVDLKDPIAFYQKRAEYIDNRLQQAGGNFSSMDKLARRAEAFARESTFTGEAGEMTKILKQGLEAFPLMKFLIPFVNTPMQILNFGWRRTLPGLMFEKLTPMITKTAKQRRKEYSKLGPMEKAAEKGRMVTAVGTTAALAYYAGGSQDRITGGGPRNSAERKALEATGWRPYAFVITGEDGTKTYVSYQRLDPLATMIGVFADYAEFSSMNPDLEEDSAEFLAMMGFTIAENMTDKSFLKGLNNVINIFREPDVYIPKTGRDIASAMAVPMFIDKIKNVDGQQMIRENRSIADAILRKLPIAQEKVPPKRTFLGEAIYRQNPVGLLGPANPIYVSSKKNDIVDEKIQSMLYGFSMPPQNYTNHPSTNMREFYNEKGDQAYDRFLELTSETKINNRTLRNSLKALFTSSGYRRMEDNYNIALQNGETIAKDPRAELVGRVISRYRRLAKKQMLNEFPELEQQVLGLKARQRQLRAGQPYNPIPQL